MHKASGLVRDVFRTRNMRDLPGNWGIAHVRYPTAGSASAAAEAQPFYVNSPVRIDVGPQRQPHEFRRAQAGDVLSDLRHINTNSDSEVLLNVLAHELQAAAKSFRLDEETVFTAVAGVHRRCRGAYATVAMISGTGLLAFRDPYGIRPLVIGRNDTPKGTEWLVASESVALDVMGFKLVRDVAPGEAILIDTEGRFHSRQCAGHTVHAPCMFEFVYLARPDSLIDGISVYDARIKMGEFLARKLRSTMPHLKVDVVIPIPDSSRPSAMEMAHQLNVPYREGFVKNRYIGRTFIMPGQAIRRKSVRQKLNTIHQEFKGKNVLLVDDSIVRGTTSREIVQMARDAGASKVFMASAAPPVRYANVYGIDMPTKGELIASDRTEEEICAEIGADALIYQDLDDLKLAVQAINPAISVFETSCFDGFYVTGDVTQEYLSLALRPSVMTPRASSVNEDGGGQMDLNLVSRSES
jgi:amidophosphoribosyltransferase